MHSASVDAEPAVLTNATWADVPPAGRQLRVNEDVVVVSSVAAGALAATSEPTRPRTSLAKVTEFSAGPVSAGIDPPPETAAEPPTLPDADTAEAVPEPLTLIDNAAPVDAPVAPEAGLDDPPLPVADALPCRARATDTAHRHAAAAAGPDPVALDSFATRATNAHRAVWIEALWAVWGDGNCAAAGAGRALGVVASAGGVPVGVGAVDVGSEDVTTGTAAVEFAEAVGVSVGAVAPAEVAEPVDVGDSDEGADPEAELVVVGVADGVTSSPRAVVIETHSQHAATAAPITAARL